MHLNFFNRCMAYQSEYDNILIEYCRTFHSWQVYRLSTRV